VYAVLIASGSAAVVLPIVQERRLTGQAVLTVVAQVTVADIAATIAIPFVLRPSKALEVAGGTVLIATCVILIFSLGRQLGVAAHVRALRREGKQHRTPRPRCAEQVGPIPLRAPWAAHVTFSSNR
jgi:Kef-type K+ transport system membrane component KefB